MRKAPSHAILLFAASGGKTTLRQPLWSLCLGPCVRFMRMCVARVCVRACVCVSWCGWVAVCVCVCVCMCACVMCQLSSVRSPPWYCCSSSPIHCLFLVAVSRALLLVPWKSTPPTSYPTPYPVHLVVHPLESLVAPRHGVLIPCHKLRTSHFLHGRHCTVPCIMQIT